MSILVIGALLLIGYVLYRFLSWKSRVEGEIEQRGGVKSVYAGFVDALKEEGLEVRELTSNSIYLHYGNENGKIGAELVVTGPNKAEVTMGEETPAGEKHEVTEIITSASAQRKIAERMLAQMPSRDIILSSSDTDSREKKDQSLHNERSEPENTSNEPRHKVVDKWGDLEDLYSEKESINRNMFRLIIHKLYNRDNLKAETIRENLEVRSNYPEIKLKNEQNLGASPSLVNHMITKGDDLPKFWDNWFFDAYPDVFRWFIDQDEDSKRQFVSTISMEFGKTSNLDVEKTVDIYRRLIDIYLNNVYERLEAQSSGLSTRGDRFRKLLKTNEYKLKDMYPCISIHEIEKGEVIHGVRVLSNGTWPKEGAWENNNGDDYRTHSFMLLSQYDFDRLRNKFGFEGQLSWDDVYKHHLSLQDEKRMDYEIERGKPYSVSVKKHNQYTKVIDHNKI